MTSVVQTTGNENGMPSQDCCTAGVSGSAADVEKYLVHLAHLDMALPLKIELIRAVRGIMQSFVDRAFGDDPVQLRAGSGAQLPEGNSAGKDASRIPGVVALEPIQATENRQDLTGPFRHSSGRGREEKREDS